MQRLHRSAVYNRVSEQRLDEEQHQQAAGEVRNSRQASRQRQTQCSYWWKRRQLSRCCCVRKTNVRTTEQSEKFHMRQGIHRSSVSQIIHKDMCLKCCKKMRAQQLTEAHSMHASFSVCSLRDDNAITYMKRKHTNSILESFEYFCQISSKSILIISSYTVSKLGNFLRHSVEIDSAVNK